MNHRWWFEMLFNPYYFLNLFGCLSSNITDFRFRYSTLDSQCLRQEWSVAHLTNWYAWPFPRAVTEQMFVMISGKCPCPQTAPNHARHGHFWQEQSTRSVFQVYARHLSYRILTRRASMVSSGKWNCPTLRISGELEYSVPSWCPCLNALHACRLRLPAFLCLNSTVATQGRRSHHIAQLFWNDL